MQCRYISGLNAWGKFVVCSTLAVIFSWVSRMHNKRNGSIDNRNGRRSDSAKWSTTNTKLGISHLYRENTLGEIQYVVCVISNIRNGPRRSMALYRCTESYVVNRQLHVPIRQTVGTVLTSDPLNLSPFTSLSWHRLQLLSANCIMLSFINKTPETYIMV